MTYVFSLSCSVLMSKFMRSPRSVSRGSLTRRPFGARVLLLLLRRRGRRRRELLDQLPDLGCRGRARTELEVALVALDGGRVVACLLGRPCKVGPGIGLIRRELRDLVVRGLDARVGELHLLAQVVHGRVGPLRRGLLERVRAERRAQL